MVPPKSRWWNPRERRGWPVLPVGARRPAGEAREGGAPTGRTGPGVFRPKRNDERRAATRATVCGGSPAVSGAGRKHRVDPGAEGTGGGTTRPPSLLARERRPGFLTGCSAGMDRRPSPHRENWAVWVPLPAVELPDPGITGDYRGLPGITGGITGYGPQLPGNRHGCAYRSSVPDERLSPAPALRGRKPAARAISRARAHPHRWR